MGAITYDSTEKKYCFSEADNYDMVKSLMDTFWDRNSNLEVKMSEEEWNRRSAIINVIRNLISLIDNVEFYRSGFSMSHFTLETREMVRVEDDEGSFDIDITGMSESDMVSMIMDKMKDIYEI